MCQRPVQRATFGLDDMFADEASDEKEPAEDAQQVLGCCMPCQDLPWKHIKLLSSLCKSLQKHDSSAHGHRRSAAMTGQRMLAAVGPAPSAAWSAPQPPPPQSSRLAWTCRTQVRFQSSLHP